MREFLRQIYRYITSVSSKIEIKNILEMLILAVLIYYLIAWIKKSRAWVLLRGVVTLFIFIILANVLELNVLSYIADRTLSILVIALLVLFQPELRAALEQIGQGKLLRYFLRAGRSKNDALYAPEVIEAIVEASYAMGEQKTGALIVMEREINLSNYIKTGIKLDSTVSSALLINIFEHNTPLHDGAVILQGNRLAAATCYLPLSQNMSIGKELGTRHRAAIGLSEETDSWIVVVSEETGWVSLARGGQLLQNLKPEDLKNELFRIEEDLKASPLLPHHGKDKTEKTPGEEKGGNADDSENLS